MPTSTEEKIADDSFAGSSLLLLASGYDLAISLLALSSTEAMFAQGIAIRKALVAVGAGSGRTTILEKRGCRIGALTSDRKERVVFSLATL